jgi:hypothetical protein
MGVHQGQYAIYDIPIKDVTFENTCDKCEGTGRLVMTTKIKFRPMDAKKSLVTQIIRNPDQVI